ncbi:unnamed protein product [marine sediment metagenome]|uniref:NusB/RsmB/TIM44 domain-containing protein n=1 Tax=marine sediment metagenome TaxID=412755 RepID=X0TMJ8_9ZZZZ
MNILKTSKVKERFHQADLQITVGALVLLEGIVSRQVDQWVNNTKEGNVKRLTEHLVWVALGRNNL